MCECHDKFGTGECYQPPGRVLWKWKGISRIHLLLLLWSWLNLSVATTFLPDWPWSFEERALFARLEYTEGEVKNETMWAKLNAAENLVPLDVWILLPSTMWPWLSHWTSLMLFPHLLHENAPSQLIKLMRRILITLAKYPVMVKAEEMGIKWQTGLYLQPNPCNGKDKGIWASSWSL